MRARTRQGEGMGEPCNVGCSLVCFHVNFPSFVVYLVDFSITSHLYCYVSCTFCCEFRWTFSPPSTFLHSLPPIHPSFIPPPFLHLISPSLSFLTTLTSLSLTFSIFPFLPHWFSPLSSHLHSAALHSPPHSHALFEHCLLS